MRRRGFLGTAAAVTVAGCLGSRGDSHELREPASSRVAESTQVRPGTFEDFTDLGRWSVFEGSVSEDTERSVVGGQCARFEASNEETRIRARTSFDPPLDLTDVAIGLSLSADDACRPTLMLFDDEGNRADCKTAVLGDIPFYRHDFGITATVGDPDLTSIVECELVCWVGDHRPLTLWCDDLHFVPRPETGAVMVQFDDGHETDYTEALPILDERDIPAVTFVNPEHIERGEDGGGLTKVSIDHLDALDDAGWTVANHTMGHDRLTELDRDEQEAQIVSGKEWLVDHGFEDGADFFAYPFNAYDATSLELVEEHHTLATAGGHPVTGYTTTPMLSRRISEPTADEAEVILDRTAELRGITQVFYHRLEGDLLADFEAMADHLHELAAAGDVDVILPADVAERFVYDA